MVPDGSRPPLGLQEDVWIGERSAERADNLEASGLLQRLVWAGDWGISISPGCPRWQQVSRDTSRAGTSGMQCRKDREGREPPIFLVVAVGHLLTSYKRKEENRVCMKGNEGVSLLSLNNSHFRHQVEVHGQTSKAERSKACSPSHVL